MSRNDAARVITDALAAAEAQGFEVITKTDTAYVRNPSTGVGDHITLAPGGNRGLPNALAKIKRVGVTLDGGHKKKRVINLTVVPPIIEEEDDVPQQDDDFEAALAMLREAHYAKSTSAPAMDLSPALASASAEVQRLSADCAALREDNGLLLNEVDRLTAEVSSLKAKAAQADAAIDLITEVAQVAADNPISAVQLIMKSLTTHQ